MTVEPRLSGLRCYSTCPKNQEAGGAFYLHKEAI